MNSAPADGLEGPISRTLLTLVSGLIILPVERVRWLLSDDRRGGGAPFFIVPPRQNLLLPVLQSKNREVPLGLLHRADKPERRHCYFIALWLKLNWRPFFDGMMFF